MQEELVRNLSISIAIVRDEEVLYHDLPLSICSSWHMVQSGLIEDQLSLPEDSFGHHLTPRRPSHCHPSCACPRQTRFPIQKPLLFYFNISIQR